MKPNIDQNKLIDQINIYRQMDGGNALSSEGFCHGFSIVHAYMAATDKLDWWYAALEQLASWDGKKESLDTEITLPNADPNEKNKTLGYLLKRIVSYVLYNQADVGITGIEGNNQIDFLNNHNPSLKAHNPFFSESGGIRIKTNTAGCMYTDMLKQLLMQSFFEQQNTIFLVESLNHSCSIRFDSKTKTWRFYDPNYHSGEKSFEKIDDLIREIHTRLGKSLHITAASWDSGFKTDIFENEVKKLTTDSAISLLNRYGLHLIAQYAPSQLADIFTLAKNHEYIIPSLAYALRVQTDDDGWTGLHKIAYFAPDQLTNLIALAEKHDNIREALATTLKVQNKNDWTCLHIIARHAPNQLADLIKLAEKHDNIREALADTLRMKNKDGLSGLHMIANDAENQLASIFTLAEKHNDVLFSVVDALKIKYYHETTLLDVIALHSVENAHSSKKLIKIVEDIGKTRLKQISDLIKELDIYIAKKTPEQSGTGGNTVKKTGAEKLEQYLLDVRTGKKDLDSALKDIQSILKDESNKKGVFKKWSANLNPNNFFTRTGIIKREGNLERFYLRAESILSTAAKPSQKLTH